MVQARGGAEEEARTDTDVTGDLEESGVSPSLITIRHTSQAPSGAEHK